MAIGIKVTELETISVSDINGDVILHVIKDGKSYQTTLGDILAGLQIKTD
jgi:hypothetical protein